MQVRVSPLHSSEPSLLYDRAGSYRRRGSSTSVGSRPPILPTADIADDQRTPPKRPPGASIARPAGERRSFYVLPRQVRRLREAISGRNEWRFSNRSRPRSRSCRSRGRSGGRKAGAAIGLVGGARKAQGDCCFDGSQEGPIENPDVRVWPRLVLAGRAPSIKVRWKGP